MQIANVDNKILNEKFTNRFKTGYITVDGFQFPKLFEKLIPGIENLDVYNDDVWVTSFPKSGTTWTQEMVWLIANDLDYEKAKDDLDARFPFLEFSAMTDYKQIKEELHLNLPPYLYESVETVKDTKRPRFIKTHLPWNLLPKQMRNHNKKPKIIHVVRNPKDACVSFYHHSTLLDYYTGRFEEYCELFLTDRINFTPFWKNVASYWEQRHQSNILFLRYEDMKKDLPNAIRKVAKFLEKNLSDEQVSTLNRHLSFENMKNNAAVNKNGVVEELKKLKLVVKEGNFMRTGKADNYKTIMSDELIKRFDKWIEDNISNMKPLFNM